jgi:hypothetical protein
MPCGMSRSSFSNSSLRDDIYILYRKQVIRIDARQWQQNSWHHEALMRVKALGPPFE